MWPFKSKSITPKEKRLAKYKDDWRMAAALNPEELPSLTVDLEIVDQLDISLLKESSIYLHLRYNDSDKSLTFSSYNDYKNFVDTARKYGVPCIRQLKYFIPESTLLSERGGSNNEEEMITAVISSRGRFVASKDERDLLENGASQMNISHNDQSS